MFTSQPPCEQILESLLIVGGDGVIVEVVVGVRVQKAVAQICIRHGHVLLVEDHLQTEAGPHVSPGLKQFLVIPVLHLLGLLNKYSRLGKHTTFLHAKNIWSAQHNMHKKRELNLLIKEVRAHTKRQCGHFSVELLDFIGCVIARSLLFLQDIHLLLRLLPEFIFFKNKSEYANS